MKKAKRANTRDDGFFGGFDSVPRSNVDDFDRGFGLDYSFEEKISEKPLFQDVGFTDDYMRSRTEHAYADNKPYAPEAISNNYNDDVSEEDIIGSDFTQPKSQKGFDNMLLFDHLDGNVGGQNIAQYSNPVREPSHDVKIKRRFARARKEALATGGNPLSNTEERRYSRIAPTRNFGRAGSDGDEIY